MSKGPKQAADDASPASSSGREVTQLLLAWNAGNDQALERITELVYEELRLMARRFIRRERPGNVLQTTALVHEAYLRLIDASAIDWENRSHFYGIAARVMRRVLVDLARSESRVKRGGGAQRVELEDMMLVGEQRDVSILDLDAALEHLSQSDERKARVVELRFFGGLSVEETARVLEVSRDTVLRDWRVAKLRLLRTMSREGGS